MSEEQQADKGVDAAEPMKSSMAWECGLMNKELEQAKVATLCEAHHIRRVVTGLPSHACRTWDLVVVENSIREELQKRGDFEALLEMLESGALVDITRLFAVKLAQLDVQTLLMQEHPERRILVDGLNIDDIMESLLSGHAFLICDVMKIFRARCLAAMKNND